MLKEIAKKIGTLPTLGETFVSINSLDIHANKSSQILAKIVEKDPMLCANILKMANSPLYGFSREISSVFQAISLFGISTSKQLIIKLCVKEFLPSDIQAYGVNPTKFVDISNMQGFMLRNWHKTLSPALKDIYFLAALLQDSGKLFIAKEIKLRGLEEEFLKSINKSSIIEAEMEFIGTTTAKVSGMIFEHWGFSKLLVDGIKNSDETFIDPSEKYYKLSKSLKITKDIINVKSLFDPNTISKSLKEARVQQLGDQELKSAVEEILSRVKK